MSLVSLAKETEGKRPFPSNFFETEKQQNQTTILALETLQGVISKLDHSQNPPLNQHQVTFHSPLTTQISITESPKDKQIQSSFLNPQVAAKKKKKKPRNHSVSASAQAAVSQQLGSSFALNKTSFSRDIVATSILERFPTLSQNEKLLLIRLIEEYSALENINLMEVFLAEFTKDQAFIEENLPTLKTFRQHTADQLEKVNHEFNISKEVYLLYLFFYDEFELDIERKFDPSIYRNIPETIEYLRSFSLFLKNAKDEFQQRYDFKIKISEKFPKITQTYINSYQPILQRLDHFIDKTNLFAKALEHKDFTDIFLTKKIANWSESHVEFPLEILMDQTVKFISSIYKFIKFAQSVGILNNIDESYWKVLKCFDLLAKTKFSKTSIASFLSDYKECSYRHLAKLENLIEYISEAIRNPKFTYAKYCLDRKLPIGKEHTQEKFVAILYHTAISTHLTDGWINHAHHAIKTHLLADFEGVFFNPIESYVQRLLTMLELVTTSSAGVFDDEIDNPLVKEICNPIEQLITHAENEVKKQFEDISLEETYQSLNRTFSKPMFRLLDCFSELRDLYYTSESYNVSELKLDQILFTILEEVKKVKDNLQMTPLKLKSEIGDYLLTRCINLAAYIMIIYDTKKLHNKSHANDTIHLLPDCLAELLSLKGFDEIFLNQKSEPLTTTSLNLQEDSSTFLFKELESKKECNTPCDPHDKVEKKKRTIKQVNSIGQRLITQDEALAHSDDKAKKTPLPQPKDFYHASNLTLMDKLLHRMKFHLDHIRGDHFIYRQDETRKIVVVPQHLNKKGTLKSIRKQAFDAQQDKKRDQ